MKTTIRRFLRDEEGAAAIEYVLIGGLIAFALAVGAGLLGGALNTWFTNAATHVGTIAH
jgi:pilus assembly protein Flp/PilA